MKQPQDPASIEGCSMEHVCADTDLKEYVAAAVLRSAFLPEPER